jgi:hypothetical protein
MLNINHERTRLAAELRERADECRRLAIHEDHPARIREAQDAAAAFDRAADALDPQPGRDG